MKFKESLWKLVAIYGFLSSIGMFLEGSYSAGGLMVFVCSLIWLLSSQGD